MPRFVFCAGLGDEFPLQVEACFSMGGIQFSSSIFKHVRQSVKSNDNATTSCWTTTSRSSHSPNRWNITVTPRNWALTFSIQDIVSWEHDTAAHDVSLKATWTKSISNPTAMEDLPIIYQREWLKKNPKSSVHSLCPSPLSCSISLSLLCSV